MKKTVSLFIFVVAILLQFNIAAAAQSSYIVRAEDAEISSEEISLVPVKIEGNEGIMGFKITVSYDENDVRIMSVTKGDVTDAGNFSTNFGLTEGSFDVLWNNTQDVSSDGSLFILSLCAVNGFSGQTAISISYSQQDTFDESYNDVVLDCRNITVNSIFASASSGADDGESDSDALINSETNQTVTSAQTVLAIDTAMEECGYTSLQQAKEDQNFIEKVNKNLMSLSGEKYNLSSGDEVEELYNNAYESNYIYEIMNYLTPYDINSAVNASVSDADAETIYDVAEENKQGFVECVDEQIKEFYPEAPNISEDLTTDKAFEVIEKLYSLNSQKEDFDEEKTDGVTDGTWKTAAFIASIIAVALILTVVIILLEKRVRRH